MIPPGIYFVLTYLMTFYQLQAVDNDGSGEISIEEFKLYFNCLGLSDEVSGRVYICKMNFPGSLIG